MFVVVRVSSVHLERSTEADQTTSERGSDNMG